MRHRPGGDRQALGQQQTLGVGFLDLHLRIVAERARPGRSSRLRRVGTDAGGAPRRSGRRLSLDFEIDQTIASSTPSAASSSKRSARPAASASVPETSSAAETRIVEPDADRPSHGRRVAAHVRTGALEVRESLDQALVDPAEPGRIPRVGPASGEPKHPLALGRHEDRDATVRRWHRARHRQVDATRPSSSRARRRGGAR